MNTPRTLKAQAIGWAVACLLIPNANAALFEDDEARRAILDLRQRVERQNQEIQQVQRSLLEQQNQFEAVRAEMARLRGEKEQLTQELRQQQEASKAAAQAVDDRLRKFEPIKVKVDSVEFLADPAEIKAYDLALSVFRQGDFVSAGSLFADFTKRYGASGYMPTALFWLGNAQYANRDYKEAIRNFEALLSKSPEHPRAPEAMLSIANCQLELKDIKPARKTLDDLIKNYPQSEAAGAARERLAKLK